MIMDDPDFFPVGPLPEPNLDMFVLSQNTNKTSSQMSPQSMLSGGSSSGPEQFPINLGLRHSSVSDPRASPHGLRGLSSTQKPAALDGDGDIFGMDEMAGPLDWGIEIDADGNIVDRTDPGPSIAQDELELPILPSIEGAVNTGLPAEQSQLYPRDGDMIIEEQPLPDAEALPGRNREEQLASEEREHQQAVQTQRKRKVILADGDTEVSRNALRDWQHNYTENCTTRKPRPVTATQAKRNAILLTFGLGIASVGQNLGIPGMIHPLAEQFSGDSLFTAYTGLEILEKGRGKRVQSATESIEDEEDGEQRKRPRLEGYAEEGRGLDVEEIIDNGQDALQSPPEIGREAQPALDDHPSSVMPWNRGSSLMPGSSIQGSARPRGDQPSSPLGNRGSAQDIVRLSDDAAMGGLDDDGFDFGGGGDVFSSDHLPFDGMPPPAIPETPSQKKSESQSTRKALDLEAQNFLSFVQLMVRENGEHRRDEDLELHRKWVDFDDLFVPKKTDRMVAAQAFYHVLGLVTKGEMVVEQDGADDEPFGGIHVGVEVAPGA